MAIVPGGDAGTDEAGTAAVARALAASLDRAGIQALVTPEIPEKATAVIFLALKAATDDEAIALCRDAFVAARKFAARATENGGAFVTIQDTGGDFACSGNDRAMLGGIAGLTKTAELEWPLASVKAIDLECANRGAEVLASAITAELLEGGPELEVGLRADGRRTTLVSRKVAIPGHELVLKPAPESATGMPVLVCSGGARGVTAATLIALARRSPMKIALLGRTRLEDEPAECVGVEGEANLKRTLMIAAKTSGQKVKPAEIGSRVWRILGMREIRSTMAALTATGSEVSYVSADVASVVAVADALRTVRAQWGPITALIHGAGVVADKHIADKTDEQFERVMSPKVAGVRALLHATADDPLDTIILFSSVAARTGNVGQCDYAMANEILNKVAARERKRRPHCQVKSLNWGPWEGGMVTPSLKAYFESHNVALIPLEVGAKMLVDEIVSNDDAIEIVLGGEPKRQSIAGNANDRQRQFLVRVAASTHPYLTDHRIDGAVVLPMVQVLEWFTRAVEALHPGQLVGACRNVKVLRGVVLRNYDEGVDSLVLSCSALKAGVVQVALCDATEPRIRHYSAELDLSSSLGGLEWPDSTKLVLAEYAQPVYGNTLFHGPAFQVIGKVDGVCDEGIVANLETTDAKDWRGGPWRTDPAALDGGLQLALLWARHRLGGRALPTGLGTYHRLASKPPSGSVSCSLVGRIEGSNRAVSDIMFRDDQGQLLAVLQGVETHQRP